MLRFVSSTFLTLATVIGCSGGSSGVLVDPESSESSEKEGSSNDQGSSGVGCN